LAVCVDAYHYFGVEEDYLDRHLAPLVKAGGEIAVAVPGLKEEFAGRPSRALALLGGEYEPSFLPVVAGAVEKV